MYTDPNFVLMRDHWLMQAELKMQQISNVRVHNLSPGMVTTELLMSGMSTYFQILMPFMRPLLCMPYIDAPVMFGSALVPYSPWRPSSGYINSALFELYMPRIPCQS